MLQFLASFEFLLATGVTLCIFGVVIRTFAQSQRRAASLRRQEIIAARQLDPTHQPAAAPEPPPTFVERHLRSIARLVFALGALLCLVSLLRRP